MKLTIMTLALVALVNAPAFASNAPCELIDKGGYKTWNNGACARRVENNEKDNFGGAPEEAEPSEPSEPSEPCEEV